MFTLARDRYECALLCRPPPDAPAVELTGAAILRGALVHHIGNLIGCLDDSSDGASRWEGSLSAGCVVFSDGSGNEHSLAFDRGALVGVSFELDSNTFSELQDALDEEGPTDHVRLLWERARDALVECGAPGATGLLWIDAEGRTGEINLGSERTGCYLELSRPPSGTERDIAVLLAARAARGPTVLTDEERETIEDWAQPNNPEETSEGRLAHVKAQLAVIGISWDGPATEPGERSVWVYEGGWFEKLKSGRWFELSYDIHRDGWRGRFEETHRTADYVELFDARREMSLRLSHSEMTWKLEGEDQWKPLLRGRWRTR